MAEIKVPFHRAAITKAEEDAVLDVLRSGWLTTGRYALEFEKKFSAAVSGGDEAAGRKPVISLAVNSNTSGMILAMEACGVKAGTAVITTPYTFVSTAACARHLNADVFFADVEKDTYSIDPDKIEEILKTTQNKLIYQEQFYAICAHLGINGLKADEWRKAICKRKQVDREEIRNFFYDKVGKEVGKTLFDYVYRYLPYTILKAHVLSLM